LHETSQQILTIYTTKVKRQPLYTNEQEKVVIKILQGSVLIQTVLDGL